MSVLHDLDAKLAGLSEKRDAMIRRHRMERAEVDYEYREAWFKRLRQTRWAGGEPAPEQGSPK